MANNITLQLSSVEQLFASRNRKVARQQSSRWGKAGVMVLVLFVAGFIISSLVWAWANLQQTNLNYQISQTQEMQKQYFELNRRLRVELSNLTSISRLEKLAVEQYGMGPPQPYQIVQLP
ncbi:MAG: cell division protein FtsL [Thermodesulfobacteriota bacterium]